MEPERIAVELFIDLATYLQREPRSPMGDSFEEWLFWRTHAAEHYRSAREGVARVEIPAGRQRFDVTLWQSLLEHPDLIVEQNGTCLGVECKSLAASTQFIESGSGVPCRTTIDFNSTVPCGQENYKGKFERYVSLKGQPIRVFYALGLYGELDEESHVLSLLLVDGHYINRDYRLHQEHRNVSRGGFGSYGDGRIRERKMYLFPNSLTDGDLVGSVSLVTEIEDLEREYSQLIRVMTKVRRTSKGKEYPFYVYRLRGKGNSSANQ